MLACGFGYGRYCVAGEVPGWLVVMKQILHRMLRIHSLLQELGADNRFPGMGTEDRNLKRMSRSVISLT